MELERLRAERRELDELVTEMRIMLGGNTVEVEGEPPQKDDLELRLTKVEQTPDRAGQSITSPDCTEFVKLKELFEAIRIRLDGHMEELEREVQRRVDLEHKVAALVEENKELRRNSVTIQQQAEQEEEFISNTLLKRIQRLKQEKESLAINYEQEEEFLTNDLTKKLQKVKAEKVEMEKTFEAESEAICNRLSAKIDSLERQLKDIK